MIIDMVRVRLLGPRDRIGDVLDVLQDAGVFQPARIRSSRLQELPDSAERERRSRQLARVLEDVEHVLERLPPRPSASMQRVDSPDLERLAGWARLARRTRRELEQLEGERAALREERGLLTRYIRFHEAFRRLMGREAEPSSLRTYPLVLDSAGAAESLHEGLQALLGDDYELRTERQDEGEIVALLLVPEGRSGRVEELMGEAGVRELPAPPGVRTRTLSEALPAIYDRLVDLDEREQEIDDRFATLAEEHASELLAARASLRDRLAELEALGRVATTDRAFILEGWVPEESEADLAQRIEAAFDGAVLVERLAREAWQEGDDAPVVLSNPRLLRPFEAITGLMPLPRYGSIDPTPFVAVFFPAFFGLILGDVGYGLVLGGVAVLLHHRSREGTTLRSVAEIAGACGVASVLFGLLYGEMFGDLGHRWLGLEPLGFHREEALVPFLALAVAIGFVHIVLGLVLGMTAAVRHRAPREAVGRGISALMVVLVAVALLAAVRILPEAFFSPVVIALLVAFPILVIAEGLLAPLELLSTLGNILSYARIMALGTASVMMAVVANRMVGATGSVVVGVMFALLFHTVNFALGVFGPTVHGLRLHYVEFFGKFYDPGGSTYRPLRHWEAEGGPTEDGEEGSDEASVATRSQPVS
ncbi:MAG: V-type ATP synthase subunit I [Gemmatimonadota bacterium]